MRRSAGHERFLEPRGHAPGEVAKGAERPRNREVVAGTEQQSRVGLEISDEAVDERRLADPRLAADEDRTPLAAGGCAARLGERSQCSVQLQELLG